MRRLRQLRLLDNSTNENNSSNSAPNSLPDIALIAPEILAAQTNDTTGGLLRPSSAPTPVRPGGANVATNTPTAASNSPRRGRRSTGASRQQQPSQQQQRQQQEPVTTTTTPARAATISSADSTSTFTSGGSVPISNAGNPVTSSASSSDTSAPISPSHPVNPAATSPRIRWVFHFLYYKGHGHCLSSILVILNLNFKTTDRKNNSCYLLVNGSRWDTRLYYCFEKKYN